MIVVILSAMNSVAQSDYNKFHFGLKVSPIYSWIKVEGNNLEGDGGRMNLAYGLITEFAISKNYSFATGLEVSYRSGKFVSNGPVKLTGIQKLQYVEIPLGLKLKTNEIGYVTYYGLFGVLPGFLVKAKKSIDYEDNTSVPDIDDNSNQSDFYLMNAHLNVGAGIEYSLGASTSLTFGARYNNGLMDIYQGTGNISQQFRTDGVVIDIGLFF
jgi:hypothetical protein